MSPSFLHRPHGRAITLAFIALPLLMAASKVVGEGTHSLTELPDSVAVLETVRAFHEALEVQDSVGAMALLARDALVAESGGLETRDEYRSHHLPGDMAFASVVSRTSTLAQLRIVGTTAWVMSKSETKGSYRENAIDSRGVELVVLAKEEGGWKITAIHWSSRRAR
jgi:ketosteroid isomerase-like protein